jgi:hypothetical protein
VAKVSPAPSRAKTEKIVTGFDDNNTGNGEQLRPPLTDAIGEVPEG